MYKILRAEELTTNIYLFEVEAKRVAKACEPGQFVIVRVSDEDERIPLTISDYDREKGTITIVVQTIGAGTWKMRSLKAGDSFRDFVGPLGCASDLVYEDIEELKMDIEDAKSDKRSTGKVLATLESFINTTCPKCGAAVAGKFCGECGTKIEVPTKKFCSNCGKEVQGQG